MNYEQSTSPLDELADDMATTWRPAAHNTDPKTELLTAEDANTARQWVEAAFEGKVRQASGDPYNVHLIETEALLCGAGYGDDYLLRIAALLHDGPEDVPDKIFLEDIEQKFGGDVVRLVEGVTKERRPGQPWREGWGNFIAKLYSATDERVILVELADRNSNLRDALRNSFAKDRDDGKKVGRHFWSMYKTSTPNDQLWMYEEMLKLFKSKAAGRTSPLLQDYEANVAVLRDMLEHYAFEDEATA